MVFTRHPFFCNYWVTYNCNSKCEFCNFWRDPHLQRMGDARFSDVEKNLEDLKEIGVNCIDFTGGEPLLNKELPQMLSCAKELGFFVKLSTNGFLYPEKAQELQGLTSRIYFSFDTTDKEEYKRIRGVDGYEKLIEALFVAKELKQESCLLYTVTNETIHNIDDIVSFAKNQKIIVYVHPCFSYFHNESLDAKYIDTIKKYFWRPYVRMSLPQLEFHKNGGNNPSDPRCKVGVSTIDIGADNCLIVPCSHNSIERIPINNDLLSLYKSERWDEMYKDAGRYDFCNHCTIDCYFGMSYLDRVGSHFFRQNITSLKNIIESMRSS